MAGLDPEEAIAKLVAQNSALTAHAGRLKNISEDNRQLRTENEALVGRTTKLEADLIQQVEVLDIAKAHHQCAFPCAQILHSVQQTNGVSSGLVPSRDWN